MGRFRTVLGDIDAEQMGITYTHEHIYCNPYTAKKDPTLAITDIEGSVKELQTFKKLGGSVLVEGTAADYGRNPEKLVYASRQSGVHLIATTGYYLYDHNPPELGSMSKEEIADGFIREIQEGMDGTTIRAGQIKCAVSIRFIHENERKCLQAAAIAQKVTNAPIWIHHGGMMGMEILKILDYEGANLEKVVMGHMDRNPDPYEYKEIAKTGCYMSIDNVARVYRYPVQTNIDMLSDLLDEGYVHRIFLSADFGRSDYLKANGGGPGFAYLLEEFLPRVQKTTKITAKEIHQILVENPRNVYGCF